MLCSSCSRVVKPVVAIDIDGTLGKYHEHFLKFANDYLASYHHTHFEYTGKESFREWFCQTYNVDLTTFRQVKLAYRQGGLKRSMHAYDGAVSLVRDVKAAGAEVWLTTTRPYLRLDAIDPDTRFWLERHHIKYDSLLYDEDKYKVLAERVDPHRVVAVLDDLIEQLLEAQRVFGVAAPVQHITSWNEGGELLRFGVHSLDQASAVIQSKIKSWELKYGAV